MLKDFVKAAKPDEEEFAKILEFSRDGALQARAACWER